MAVRPLFIPSGDGHPWVGVRDLEFEWHPGFAVSQARRSIASLHEAARRIGYHHVLEISSKSEDPVGQGLSAFQLSVTLPDGIRTSVECAFQGSKVFKNGGPFTDLYRASSREAKQDLRLRGSALLQRFDFFGTEWPLQPLTLFYDWLYLSALRENTELAEHLVTYQAFTDIAFNPARSLNCQARSAALYVALMRHGHFSDVLGSPEAFLRAVWLDAPRGTQGEQIALW